MEYTQLGRTGLTVSRAGFGGGGIGQVWGPTNEQEAIASVHRALDLDITFFDVAPAYGDGKAEEALGKALEGHTEPVVVATKVRLRADEMGDVAGAVRRSVEASLRRLRRDSVDVLHVHNRFTERRGEATDSLSGDDVLGPVLEAYRSVQREGKTRFIGLSAMDHHVPTMRRLIERQRVRHRPRLLQSSQLDGPRSAAVRSRPVRQRADHPAGQEPQHGSDRHPVPRCRGPDQRPGPAAAGRR